MLNTCEFIVWDDQIKQFRQCDKPGSRCWAEDAPFEIPDLDKMNRLQDGGWGYIGGEMYTKRRSAILCEEHQSVLSVPSIRSASLELPYEETESNE